MAKLISVVMTQAMEEFKTSLEIRNLNVEFNQKVFINGFELYEGRMAQRFSKLNLSFLEEEEDDVEAGPSNVVVNLSFNEPASDPSEPVAEVPKPVQEPEAIKSNLTPPSKVEILK
ncbi:hypothetical protein COCNU_scaffold004776G000010 [Cocos nucifera]|nr:hypothetical protein [Cocos nucifera]